MAKNEQFQITLDAYHKWAIERVAEAIGTKRADLINRAVGDWLTAHSDQVAGAKAGLEEYLAQREAKRK